MRNSKCSMSHVALRLFHVGTTADGQGKQYQPLTGLAGHVPAVRESRTAWVKVNGAKIGLVDYRDAKSELRPCPAHKTEVPEEAIEQGHQLAFER